MQLRLGLTLLELVIVLAIIAIMITVIAPYASRSNDSLEIENQIMEIADSILYAIDSTQINHLKSRFCFDTAQNAFYLETSDQDGNYYPISASIGRKRYLSPNCNVMDVEGFDTQGKCFFIEFDPDRNWPAGSFTILSNDIKKTIAVRSRTVTVEDVEDQYR